MDPDKTTNHTLLPTRNGDITPRPTNNFNSKIWECTEKETTGIGAGDSTFIRDFLSPKEQKEMFEKLFGGEIEFQQWYHMPGKGKKPLQPFRRVKVAMAIEEDDEGRVPHYRFPVNNQDGHGVVSPMSTTIELFRKRVVEFVGVEYNHAVVLLYRDGGDCIGFHKDKILDIDEDTSIISCSLGAARWYHLRDDVKNPTTEEKILLQPGGLMILGPKTNHNYYHSVPKLEEKEGGEKEEVGPRISITLRRTLTYKDRKGVITGKGEEYQSANWPKELKGSHRIEEEGEKEG